MRSTVFLAIGLALCLPCTAANAQTTTSDTVNTFSTILNSVIGVVKELKGTPGTDPNDPNAPQPAPAQPQGARPAPPMQYATPAPQHPPFDPQVLHAQTLLNQLGYRTGVPDGIKGRVTTNAIRSFQYSRRMPETGDVDPTLLQALTQSVTAMTNQGFAPAGAPQGQPQQPWAAPSGYAPQQQQPQLYQQQPPLYQQQPPLYQQPQGMQAAPPPGYAPPIIHPQAQIPAQPLQPMPVVAAPQPPQAGHVKGGDPLATPAAVDPQGQPVPQQQPPAYQPQQPPPQR